MKIYDCFTYFDEDLILDTRLNIMNDYVDYFVIVESTYNHNGERRELKFNINKYQKFKNKIKYIVWDEVPENIEKINDNDTEIVREHKFINNAVKRDNGQRNYVVKGLDDAEDNDLILLSDLDEIPSLKTIDLKNIKTKIIIFDQIMCYYKFNLAIPNYKWFGTRGCLKKDLKSPQWLRNIKARKYSFYRLDILFNEKKFNNIQLIKNGGWHFTNIKTPEEIHYKYKSYCHHREYELSGMNSDKIKKIIESKHTIYDLKVDQRTNKIGKGMKLINLKDHELPDYIISKKNSLTQWFD
tara:strand:+ start:373 stop:1263 length:891 start_codon:yes stop_codon:yes gene_type:complete